MTGLGDDEIASARLRLTVAQDPGSGTLNVAEGATNGWTEEVINAANAPAAGGAIDSVTGTYEVGQVVEFDVASTVTGDGTYTFVLQHGGGNDVWFSSKEGGSAPQLVITRPEVSLEGDYDLDGDVDEDDEAFWRISFGSTIGDGMQADGNGDGAVDAADYTLWRDRYEASQAQGRSQRAPGVGVVHPRRRPLRRFSRGG